jgi:hypothetical protein
MKTCSAFTPDEAREVTNMAHGIAALILLQREPELDKNYEAVKAAAAPWMEQLVQAAKEMFPLLKIFAERVNFFAYSYPILYT